MRFYSLSILSLYLFLCVAIKNLACLLTCTYNCFWLSVVLINYTLLAPLHFYNHFLCDLNVSLPHQSVLSSLTPPEVNLSCYVVPEIIATSTLTNQTLNVSHHYLWEHFTEVSYL